MMSLAKLNVKIIKPAPAGQVGGHVTLVPTPTLNALIGRLENNGVIGYELNIKGTFENGPGYLAGSSRPISMGGAIAGYKVHYLSSDADSVTIYFAHGIPSVTLGWEHDAFVFCD